MTDINTVRLAGVILARPFRIPAPNGVTQARFTVRNVHGWTAKDGVRHERTTIVEVGVNRKLAERLLVELEKGDAVVVTGALAQDTWTSPKGDLRSKVLIHASAVQRVTPEPTRPISSSTLDRFDVEAVG